jgi:hypothetical protein
MAFFSRRSSKETMRTDITKPIQPYIDGQGTSGLVAFAMLAIGLPWGIWTISNVLAGTGDSQSVAFNAAMGWFVVLAFAYIGLHGLKEVAWCSVTVLLTLRALLEFIAVPAWRFVTGEQLDSVYVHAMVLTLSGFTALWVGSLIFMRQTRLQFAPQRQQTPNRVAFMSGAMFAVGLIAKSVMWKAGLLSYTAQTGAREDLIAYMELFVFLGNLLIATLVISAIEVFGKGATGFIKSIFWLSTIFSVFFGLISGMKNQLLQPLVLLVLVYSITKKRIPRSAFSLPILLVMMYPFFSAYRANLNGGYR